MIELVAPFPRSELLSLWAWGQEVRERIFDNDSLSNPDEFVADWLEQERRGRRSWAVVRDGEIGGAFISSLVLPCVADIHLLFKRNFWGHATTLRALGMACSDIFAGHVNKIETTVACSNRAALALARKCGFTRKKLLPANTFRAGEPLVDVVVIGLDRDAFIEQGAAK